MPIPFCLFAACRADLKGLSDFYAARRVLRRGKAGNKGLRRLETRCLYNGLYRLMTERVFHVLPTSGQILVVGNGETVAQFIDQVGTVADQYDVATCLKGNAGAFFDAADSARALHGQIVRENHAFEPDVAAQNLFQSDFGKPCGLCVHLRINDVGGHDRRHTFAAHNAEGGEVGGFEFVEAAPVFG